MIKKSKENFQFGHGKLALSIGYYLPLMVLRSAAGFYIGTANEEGPCSRESKEYYHTGEEAKHALENKTRTQADSEESNALLIICNGQLL